MIIHRDRPINKKRVEQEQIDRARKIMRETFPVDYSEAYSKKIADKLIKKS